MRCFYTRQLRLEALAQLMAHVCTPAVMHAQTSEQHFCSNC